MFVPICLTSPPSSAERRDDSYVKWEFGPKVKLGNFCCCFGLAPPRRAIACFVFDTIQFYPDGSGGVNLPNGELGQSAWAVVVLLHNSKSGVTKFAGVFGDTVIVDNSH